MNGIMEPLHRYRGALLGLAVGDALGAPVEGSPPAGFSPVLDMTAGALPAGHWTDDTAMALCLADSLIECRGFDAADQMRRYLRWLREGYRSSTGVAFGIGRTVHAALRRFEQTGEVFAGSTDPRTAGNGSLMRLAPVPLAYARHPETAVGLAAQSSRTTHGAAEAVDACRYFAGLLVGALAGETKATLLAPGYAPVPGLWAREPLAPAIADIAAGSYRERRPPAIRGTAYVVQGLEAALWCFATTDDFASGALAAVSLGDDTDTTAAVYGQLAGAFYGVPAIPGDWRRALAHRTAIRDLADLLLVLAGHVDAPGHGAAAS